MLVDGSVLLLPFWLKKLLGMTPDVITYNASVSTCEKGQQWTMPCDVFAPKLYALGMAVSLCKDLGS